MTELRPGMRLRHFKGKEYEVVALARDSDTLEEVVVYKALYDSEEFGAGAVWVRPKKEFFDKKEVDGKEVLRFEVLDPDSL